MEEKLTNAEYHGSEYRDYLSSSDIKVLAEKPPAYFRWYREQQKEPPTAAMIFGSQYHAYMQSAIEAGDESLFENEYRILEDIPGCPINPTTGRPYGSDTKKMQEFFACAEIIPEQLLSADSLQQLRDMKKALWSDIEIRRLIHGAKCEQSFFNENFSGIKTKYRTDLRIEKKIKVLIGDWKTCGENEPHPAEFPKTIIKRLYHISGAWYADNDRELNGKEVEFFWIVQEKTPPYGYEVYFASPQMLACGTYQYQQAIDVYKYCTETGEWPSYKIYRPKSETGKRFIQYIDLPAWYTGQLEKYQIIL
uniref:Putative exodeoxyribonuclease 8 PDDEXK-like domain-containing protein n=1 Tax=viral metagenome TaxID=1070528 RepID=A0A6M3J5F8_9ZZZZ